eukprot:PITA_30362
MVDEMASLHKNEARDLVLLPAGRKPIGSKWVFKKKTNAEEKVEKCKARLVAQGYSQVPGIDFGDIFSSVAKITSIRLLLSVAAAFDFEDSKPVRVPILVGVTLSIEQCPKAEEEEEDMSRVPYSSAIGSLTYAMVCTRPDIAHVVGVLSRFMSKPGKEHWTVVKRVFRYLRGTSDSVSWMSKKESIVAISTTEAEYMAATHASKEVVLFAEIVLKYGVSTGSYKDRLG